jgi:hypothetical protein
VELEAELKTTEAKPPETPTIFDPPSDAMVLLRNACYHFAATFSRQAKSHQEAMSTEPFDEILKRFEELSPSEQERLLNQLEQCQAKDRNGRDPPRNLLESFNERGLIGSIKDAPSDWSTNPKYMEGFGNENDGE